MITLKDLRSAQIYSCIRQSAYYGMLWHCMPTFPSMRSQRTPHGAITPNTNLKKRERAPLRLLLLNEKSKLSLLLRVLTAKWDATWGGEVRRRWYSLMRASVPAQLGLGGSQGGGRSSWRKLVLALQQQQQQQQPGCC